MKRRAFLAAAVAAPVAALAQQLAPAASPFADIFTRTFNEVATVGIDGGGAGRCVVWWGFDARGNLVGGLLDDDFSTKPEVAPSSTTLTGIRP